VLQPISDPNEMNLPQEEAIARLSRMRHMPRLPDVFGGPSPGRSGRALCDYLRTIRSGDSPYDRFIAGQHRRDEPPNSRRLQLFRGQGPVFSCATSTAVHGRFVRETRIAWRIDPQTRRQVSGRRTYTVTQLERDRGGFKVRRCAKSPHAPYMHDGSLTTLEDVLEFYDPGGRRESDDLEIAAADWSDERREARDHRLPAGVERTVSGK
jgi:cytochrome c peroxidase